VEIYNQEGEDVDSNMWPTLPRIFEKPVNYFELWHLLFLYETYNQMINKRNESDKDREMAKMYGLKVKNDHSQKNFPGVI